MKALLLALLLLAAPAQAHKLKLFVTMEGNAITGTAYFSGGARAVGIPGRVQAPDGAVVAELRTGEDGSFRFEAATVMDHTVTFDSGDGHVASAVVSANGLPQGISAAAPREADADVAAMVEAAVARQIRPLRQQLDAYEDRIRLHDIIGGIGTIFGLFGIIAWLSARRRAS
jgi:nickel transport protein